MWGGNRESWERRVKGERRDKSRRKKWRQVAALQGGKKKTLCGLRLRIFQRAALCRYSYDAFCFINSRSRSQAKITGVTIRM